MGRNRVRSFMSQLSVSYRDSRSSTPSPPADGIVVRTTTPPHNGLKRDSTPPLTEPFPDVPTPNSPVRADYASDNSRFDTSPTGSPNGSLHQQYSRPRASSRPLSMIQTYQPRIMDINGDTIPELQPIFTFLNSHGNKLYQEGYFLKLDDQNTNGRPNVDRNWTECFAQLVGTVLSLWDAAELDQAGENGEVLPKFINLTDASIKMIDSLPTRSSNEQPLQNILSVSTAGRNRYLLHFNSHHSLIQWTASIRLAMYEQSTLQEAYTGALIAGKGRTVNNIGVIMDRARFKTEEWVRVRFGAGVPWRRCWCVITPPDEKEVQKMQKDLKKRSPYDRSHAPQLRGDIKFYDVKVEGKKQKKAKPIAALNDAYAAYAIYPQSKALVDASTLVKIEGTVSIYSDPPSATEGFVFIMPEVPPAVTGFEMLLRFLFPTWDTFGLYGRPGRLVASTLDPRSLMFAMPKHRKYGYLEVGDIAGLVLEDGSISWTERQWRKKLKELTGQRMESTDDSSGTASRHPSGRSNKRLSFGPNSNGNAAGRVLPSRPKVGFAEDGANRPRTDSAPAGPNRPLPNAMAQAIGANAIHGRNFSDSASPGKPGPDGSPPRMENPMQDLQAMQRRMETPEPVVRPPAFNHTPSSRPTTVLYHSAEMRQANSRLSNSTLAHITGAGQAANAAWAANNQDNRPMMPAMGNMPASLQPGMQPGMQPQPNMPLNTQRSRSPMRPGPNGPSGPNGLSSAPELMGQQQQRPQQQGGPPRGPPRGPQQAGLQINTAVPGPQMGQMGSRPSPSLPSPQPPNRAPSPYGRPSPQTRGPPPMQANGPPQRMRTPPPRANNGPGGSPPVLRKPVPPVHDAPRNTILVEADSNYGVGVIADYYLNEADSKPIHPQELDAPGIGRHPALRYDDASSTTTPDYASTHESVHTQESAERPRAGVLRTVGDAASSQNRQPDFSIPEVDFGRTVNYAATQGTPRARTPGPMPTNGAGPGHRGPPGTPKAGGMGAPGGGQRQGAMTPDQYGRRGGPGPNQWAPANRGNNAGNPGLRRSASFDTINSGPILAPFQQQQQRPSSSGNGGGQGGRGTGDASSHLSAREQEHLARVTGGPLINMGPNGRNQPAPGGAGLVGAIAAREREKQQMKAGGYGSQAMQQQAFNQRQQQQQFMQQQQQQQGRGQQPMYNQGPYGPGPGPGRGPPQQQWPGSPRGPPPGGWPGMQGPPQGQPRPYGGPGPNGMGGAAHTGTPGRAF